MSQWKSPAADRSPDVQHAKDMSGGEGLGSDSTRNEWLQVNFLEFLATTVDLRIVLLQAEEPSILAS